MGSKVSQDCIRIWPVVVIGGPKVEVAGSNRAVRCIHILFVVGIR